MVVRCIEIKAMAGRNPSRVDTLALKLQIERKLGHEKSQKYFNLLNCYLSLKISKSEFDKHCTGVIGRDNICLHNLFMRAIIKNAFIGKIPPPKENKAGISLEVKVSNGYQRSSLQSLYRDVFPQSPRKGRTHNVRDRKFRDRPSPLGPNGKSPTVGCDDSVPKIQEQQSATELLSLGSKPPPEVNSVEEGEEVEQASRSPGVYSRSPVRAPLGISINGKETRKVLRNGSTAFHVSSCLKSGELPGISSLRTRLEKKLEMEGLKISTDCVNLLNNSLDVYLNRLINPCVELARSKSGNKHSTEVHNEVTFGLNGLRPMKFVHKANGPIFVSMLDFLVAIESDPRRLGEDWPVQLEKVCLRASDQE